MNTQWIQLSVLFAITIFFQRHKRNIQYIDKCDEEFQNIFLNHKHLSDYRFMIDKFLENYENIPFGQRVHTEYQINLNTNYEYLYIFYNKSICVYFIRENGSDYVFFEGLHKLSDLNKISFSSILRNGQIKINSNSLLEKGTLFQVIDTCFIQPIARSNLIQSFLYLSTYKFNISFSQQETQQTLYPLLIEGYSLGGIYSQLFIYELTKRNLIQHFNIQFYNIESWFQGNENEYKEFKKIVEMRNVMNEGSLFMIYNRLFQRFHNVDGIIRDEEAIKNMKRYLKRPFPLGLIEYGIEKHLLTK
jgi:hypothetical protein